MRGPCGKRDEDGARCTAAMGHDGPHFAFRAPEGPRTFTDDGLRWKAISHPIFTALGNFMALEVADADATPEPDPVLTYLMKHGTVFEIRRPDGSRFYVPPGAIRLR